MVVGADPGFSRRALIPKGGANLLLGQILLKLHENEENWTGDASKIFHVDPPLVVVCLKKMDIYPWNLIWIDLNKN